MPAGDITHPVPDLTGYITEGQLVLSPDLHNRGLYPPFDALRSLSRLMRLGAGEGRTSGDHRGVAAQVYASLASARQVSELAELVGRSGLRDVDLRDLNFADAFEERFLTQGQDEDRGFERTLQLAWEVLAKLQRRELTRIEPRFIRAHWPDEGGVDDAASDTPR